MYYFFRALLSFVFHIRYKINIMHRENIPDMKGGFIIAANHQRYADPPMISVIKSAKYSFMAKEELFEKNKFFAWLIKRCGAFPVERGSGDDEPIRKSVEVIRKNRILIIFPEGTRSKDEVIGRMRSGVILVASKAEAPVLPVCIRYSGKRRVDINVGRLIPAEELRIDEQDRRSMRKAASRIGDDLLSLQREIYESAGDPVPSKRRTEESAGDSD